MAHSLKTELSAPTAELPLLHLHRHPHLLLRLPLSITTHLSPRQFIQLLPVLLPATPKKKRAALSQVSSLNYLNTYGTYPVKVRIGKYLSIGGLAMGIFMTVYFAIYLIAILAGIASNIR